MGLLAVFTSAMKSALSGWKFRTILRAGPRKMVTWLRGRSSTRKAHPELTRAHSAKDFLARYSTRCESEYTDVAWRGRTPRCCVALQPGGDVQASQAQSREVARRVLGPAQRATKSQPQLMQSTRLSVRSASARLFAIRHLIEPKDAPFPPARRVYALSNANHAQKPSSLAESTSTDSTSAQGKQVTCLEASLGTNALRRDVVVTADVAPRPCYGLSAGHSCRASNRTYRHRRAPRACPRPSPL